jgi:glycosyltransferase involved in cell wall biosynthesis
MHLLVATISRRKLEGARLCHVHDYLGRGFLKRWIWRIALSRYDRVVAVSRSVAADLRAIPLPERKITSIHNGIRIQQFSPTGKKLDLDRLSGLTEGDTDLVRVGLVATFAKWKGHITFMRAMALLRDLKVCGYVIGGPIYQTLGSQHTLDELRAAAEKYCPNIRLGFTGGVEDVAAAYRSLDIVVHASTSPEPFGMVIIEAMACGKPVIVSRGGGAAEIFEDGVTGLAHDPGDAAMLARQIVRLTGDAGLRTQLGDNGHAAVAARFQASAMAASFAELYSEMAAATQVAACARPEGGKRCFA